MCLTHCMLTLPFPFSFLSFSSSFPQAAFTVGGWCWYVLLCVQLNFYSGNSFHKFCKSPVFVSQRSELLETLFDMRTDAATVHLLGGKQGDIL